WTGSSAIAAGGSENRSAILRRAARPSTQITGPIRGRQAMHKAGWRAASPAYTRRDTGSGRMVMPLQVRRLAESFVGEVSGVDLARLDDAATAAVKDAWLAHKVLVFHGQHLDEDGLVAFA